MSLVLVALGGNALLRRGELPAAELQRHRVEEAADAIAALANENDVVVTHGNGPQVGLLALQSAAVPGVPPYPLDVLGAESEGMIGYLLEQALGNRLPGRPVATLLTQVVVDAGDPAFGSPTKPIGALYDEDTARRLARERGWSVAPEGAGWRRVVPSPEPLDVVELTTIRLLVDAGVVVVCAGGGGIPVVRTEGWLRGIEAVIDKDLAAAFLGRVLEADALLLLTDVAAVERDFGTDAAAPIARATPEELRTLEFASGSMGPKVEAACRFAEATGRRAAIGALEQAAAVAAGTAGTQIAPSATWAGLTS